MTAPCSDGSNLVSAFATWLAAEGRADRVEDHKLQSRALLGHCRPPDSNFDFSCTKRPECTSTLGRDRIFRIWRNFESSAYAQERLLCLPASYVFFGFLRFTVPLTHSDRLPFPPCFLLHRNQTRLLSLITERKV
jgi:hypothetical protein